MIRDGGDVSLLYQNYATLPIQTLCFVALQTTGTGLAREQIKLGLTSPVLNYDGIGNLEDCELYHSHSNLIPRLWFRAI